jgi:ArsR family transcriptional regulator, arsenate/arsenite/antimonite-responsive transcriptional repressor
MKSLAVLPAICCASDAPPMLRADAVTVAGIFKALPDPTRAILRDAGLVESERRGTWAYYRLVPEAIDALRGVLGEER